MMNDVLPEIGGFIPVQIDDLGYINRRLYEDDNRFHYVVHKETRELYAAPDFTESFEAAREYVAQAEAPDVGILELTPAGGGAAVWVRSGMEETISKRLARFRGCYGAWPVRCLSI